MTSSKLRYDHPPLKTPLQHPLKSHVQQFGFPLLWPERPDVCFSQTDSQFAIAGITSETTKFHYVVSKLEQKHAAELDDLITSPPQDQPYTTLRSTLLTRLSPSIEQRHHQLHHEEMGDRKPSQFLRHLRRLTPDVPESLIRSIWTSRLPSYLQTPLL
jgi:hypothetical protein